MTIRVGVYGISETEINALVHLLYPYKVLIDREALSPDVTISSDSPPKAFNALVRMKSRLESGDKGYLQNHGNGVIDIASDLIKGSSERFQAVMAPRIAWTYKLATRLHFQYNRIPGSIRNRLLRTHKAEADLSGHLASEFGRQILLKAFALLGYNLERKRPPSLFVTHDIESERGLLKALSFKTLEDKLGIRSAWFVPSDEFAISKEIAKDLAHESTVGSHDTRHDGGLIHIGRQEELVERLRRSKQKLETLFDKEVSCFRAPLLQFSQKICAALREAGYESDFSVPCWEPVYPLTMGGFGVELLQGFAINGVVEFPLTLFQDHQVLSILGMSTKEAVQLWIDQAKLVRSFGGDIVILVHPDYAFSQDFTQYSLLLESLLEIHEQSDSDYKNDVEEAGANDDDKPS